MAVFLSRCSADQDFALEHIGELGGFYGRVFTKISQYCTAEHILTRFTFSTFKLTADTPADCERIIRAAWSEVFPGREDRVRIMTVPYSEDVEGTVIKQVLSNYYGVESYQRFAAELYLSAPILKKNRSSGALMLQNYLFAIDPGCGFTTLLSSLGDYLTKLGMLAAGEGSEKKTRYAEFTAANETGNGKTSVDDMIERFCGDYLDDVNIVGIDVSYFLEGDRLSDLRDMLRRLRRFQEGTYFAFRVPFLEKKELDRVTSVFSDVQLTRVIEVPPLHQSVLAETMWDRLRTFGIEPDASVLDVFFARIGREKADGRFYGFRTVEKTVAEMVLTKAARDAEKQAAGESVNLSVIKAEDLPGEFSEIKREISGYDELAELIGMEKITERVKEIVAQVKLAMKNEKLDRPCIHMRFLGHPGTGKTTVARIIGRIFRDEGILRKGAFLEYSARMLCAEYVGQTAVKTASICRDAYGSVLFIDEAYALYQNDENHNDYGREALTTLISEMENHRDDMLVIMAGYTDDMEILMRGNAGLRSRMPYAISFPNYTKEQLFEIFMLMVRKHFSYTESLEREARSFFENLSDEYVGSKEFANARFVRNLYERTWSKCALRASLSGGECSELTGEDFLAASSEREFSEKLTVKKARIGF